MMPVVRMAQESDLAFLIEHDRHPEGDAIAHAVTDGRVLVLDDHGTLIGWLRWTLFWDEHPFLNMIYVLKEHRGIGLGSLLLEVWEREMAESQYTTVLTSTASDERSQHLYRRRGYSDAGVLLLPSEVAELLFSKELTASAPGGDRGEAHEGQPPHTGSLL
ncbi:GNAT family N-acetyltransferase [Microbacterium sp. USHLN186]|uniref:GNAT family N-acetyltransferase n=1 Tax=Microbacterium sp. USHLN186 TaxID=3081286 RepID=UPI00301AAFF2